MEIKNIVITHGYSDSNKGDLAITQATVEGLQKRFPEAKLTLMSSFREEDNDFWFHNRKMKENDIKIIQGVLPTPYTGGESSFKRNVLAVFRLLKDYLQLKASKYKFLGSVIGGKQYKAYCAIKNSDLVIVKGGQFIYNDKENLRGNLFLWRTLQPIKIAKGLKKKVVILGQSIGGFATEKSEKFAMHYISLCDKIIVREELSYNLLKKHDINQVVLAPDTAFYINNQEVEIDLSKTKGKDILGVTVVNWSFPDNNNPLEAKENYINNLASTIVEASKKHQLFPVFVPQVTVRHHGKSDLDLIETVQNKLKENEVESIVLKEDFNANEMVGVYSKCKLLIGTRLHSCILAANAGTPVIAIRYQGFKTQGVMKMLGLEKFVHDINCLNKDELLNDINYFIDNYDDLKSDIRRATINQADGLKEVFLKII